MSLHRRIAARVAAVALALLMSAGVVSFGADDSSSTGNDEAGATWTFRVHDDDGKDDSKDDGKDDGRDWAVIQGATWS